MYFLDIPFKLLGLWVPLCHSRGTHSFSFPPFLLFPSSSLLSSESDLCPVVGSSWSAAPFSSSGWLPELSSFPPPAELGVGGVRPRHTQNPGALAVLPLPVLSRTPAAWPTPFLTPVLPRGKDAVFHVPVGFLRRPDGGLCWGRSENRHPTLLSSQAPAPRVSALTVVPQRTCLPSSSHCVWEHWSDPGCSAMTRRVSSFLSITVLSKRCRNSAQLRFLCSEGRHVDFAETHVLCLQHLLRAPAASPRR